MAKAQNIVILTGAGVSADSGVDTFRDPDGAWVKNDPVKVCTPEGFAADPALVHAFYNARRAQLPSVDPNPAHFALAKLEAETVKAGGTVTLVTQNVDNLHQRAGSERILPIHGHLDKAECTSCGKVHHWTEDLSTETPCPACDAKTMRPYIVWFGEIPRGFDEVEEAMMEADLFVAVGTSGSVYPAAGLVGFARQRAIPRVELNLEASDNATLFTEARYGKASEIVPAWVDEVLSS
ncbi:NAD-dependent deacylase [Parvularcula sp. ZS-1/3]|uniref:NAD-dependent protein deacylase n=1 Tax=Parvularcula mediterranea TaxID=2732508 RepID=A0A7Y3RJJ5_9PROT|nr:NAD-dependent deacylase [Parvularcula mediterranea]NNU15243.1 NAD-dependent deacylase [Parvularcula mediterranea]